MKNEDIIKIWEDFIEEYKKYLLSGEELWLANLEKLKEFINNNGKTPSKYNKNIDTQRLGIWLSDKKKNYNDKQFIMKNEDIIKIWKEFIEEYKDYLLTGEELWLNNLEKIKEFININGKNTITIQ